MEVPLPRGITALQWLRGQPPAAGPRVYYSGRTSSAPNTPGAARAEETTRGWSAVAGRNVCACFVTSCLQQRSSSMRLSVGGRLSSSLCACVHARWLAAGVGAAWLWRGAPGSGFSAGVMSSLSRFLSTDQPRVRVLGGVRFDPASQAGQEWQVGGCECSEACLCGGPDIRPGTTFLLWCIACQGVSELPCHLFVHPVCRCKCLMQFC